MSFVIARWIVGVFACISMVHLYWAAGGKLGSLAAIPQLPGEFARGPRPAFKPSALGTFLVALGLVAIALLVCLRAGLYFSPVSHGALQWGISAIALVMFARAIGDSELVGFQEVGGSRFARLDTYFYSPLCLLLGWVVGGGVGLNLAPNGWPAGLHKKATRLTARKPHK